MACLWFIAQFNDWIQLVIEIKHNALNRMLHLNTMRTRYSAYNYIICFVFRCSFLSLFFIFRVKTINAAVFSWTQLHTKYKVNRCYKMIIVGKKLRWKKNNRKKCWNMFQCRDLVIITVIISRFERSAANLMIIASK